MSHTPPSRVSRVSRVSSDGDHEDVDGNTPIRPPSDRDPNTVQIHSSARERVGRTAVRQDVRELLTTGPPPPTVAEPANDEACDVCGDGDGDLDDDVVANYWDGVRPRLAHTDCAPTAWRLA